MESYLHRIAAAVPGQALASRWTAGGRQSEERAARCRRDHGLCAQRQRADHRATSPQSGWLSAVQPGAGTSSRASSFRGLRPGSGISRLKSRSGLPESATPLSVRPARPGTDRRRRHSDSVRGSKGGHPKRRTRRSGRPLPGTAGRGRLTRLEASSRGPLVVSSHPWRRRMTCSVALIDSIHPRPNRRAIATGAARRPPVRSAVRQEKAANFAPESPPLCYGHCAMVLL